MTRHRGTLCRTYGLILCLGLATLFPIACMAGDDKTAADLAAYKELDQVRLESTRELLQKDVQALSTRIDTQDKRLDDQNAHIDHNLSLLGTLLSGLGIVLTVIGVAGYIQVQRKVHREAQAAAADWFGKHTAELNSQLDALKTRLRDLEAQAKSDFDSHTRSLQDILVQAQQQVQQRINEPGQSRSELPKEAAQALAQAEQAATSKPESEYTFRDWNNRAFASYAKGEKDTAARFWREAARSPSATPEETAIATVNAGVSLEQIGRHDEAIACYDEVIQRFAQDEATAFREYLARALVNKGAALGQLGRHDEAIACYDDLLRRFAQDAAPGIREQLAYAKNGKGFSRLCRAKEHWSETERRRADLELATTLFADAAMTPPDNGIILGNQAYCAHLLEQPEPVVRDALVRALKVGGQKLYEATLGDLAIHPVPDVDDAFRTLLDEVWAELRPTGAGATG